MKRCIGAIIAIFLLVGIISSFWLEHQQKTRQTPEKAESNSLSKSESDQIKTPDEVRKQQVLDLGHQDPNQIKERYFGLAAPGKDISEKAMGNLKKGKCAFLQLYDRETKTYIQGGFNVPLDTPKIELRFRKPGENGELVPARIGYMRCYRVANGRTYSLRRGEALALDCGMSRDFDYAHNARFLLAEDLDSLPYAVYLFGHKYYMEFYSPGNRTDPVGTAVIQMPEDVPPGEMAVITVDVTQKAEGWGKPSMYNRSEKKTVTFHLPEAMEPGRIVGSLYDPDMRHESPIRFGNDLTGEAQVFELGGEMIIGRGGERDGHVLYYKRRVQSTEIRLPQDADLAVNPSDVISFRVEVPQEKVSYDELGLGLLMHRDSKFPVAGVQFASVDGWRRSSKKPPERVPMNAPPGDYYVAYGKDPQVIGKITVKDSDAGKTLEVQPLEE